MPETACGLFTYFKISILTRPACETASRVPMSTVSQLDGLLECSFVFEHPGFDQKNLYGHCLYKEHARNKGDIFLI